MSLVLREVPVPMPLGENFETTSATSDMNFELEDRRFNFNTFSRGPALH
jgi:hypothetical protein